MSKRIISLIFILGFNVYAAFEIQTVDPFLIAMGGVVSIHPMSLNPANIIEEKGANFRISFSNLYGIKGLKRWEFNAGFGGKRHGASLMVHSLGNSIYQELSIGVRYCEFIRDVILLGGSIQYYSLGISGYGNAGTIGLSIGSKLYLSSDFRMALLFQNVNGPRISEEKDSLPQSFALGIQWLPNQRVEINGELFKETIFPFSTRVGMSIKIINGIRCLLGVQLNPDRFSGGVSCRWNHFQFDVAVLHHMQLPYTIFFGCGCSI